MNNLNLDNLVHIKITNKIGSETKNYNKTSHVKYNISEKQGLSHSR